MNDLTPKPYAHGHTHAQRAHKCITCMYAHRPPCATLIRCKNIEYDAMTDPTVDTAVDPNSACSLWTPRTTYQKPLTAPQQLQLDF